MPRYSKRPVYRLAGVMDTETCNYWHAGACEWVAWPILYICNDISECDITEYTPDESPERIDFYRTTPECVAWFERVIERGQTGGYIPIVCFYNMGFDIVTLNAWIDSFEGWEICAQSSTNLYYLDCKRDGKTVIRLWDTYHFELGGLAAMGRTCGIAKAVGDWDYSLIRTPETPLTDLELFYARRDVQVIPAYLRYILESNPHLSPSDLGTKVFTKTGLARIMAKKLFHNAIKTPSGTKKNPQTTYMLRANSEKPYSYECYTLRKACFMGGFTFTAGRAAFRVWHDVVSYDACSMHHTFCNGRYIPVNFRPARPSTMRRVIDTVLGEPLSEVLEHYEQPFRHAFHAEIRLTNVRLKPGTLFEEMQIGLIPESKFQKTAPVTDARAGVTASIQADTVARQTMCNRGTGLVFAFSKLLAAKECVIYANEIELWCISRVYEWDALTPMRCECTSNFKPPEPQATLMSNILYRQKAAMKDVTKHYRAGEPYTRDLDTTIPPSIANDLRAGALSSEFVQGYYTSTVKGLFNSAGYGVHAQDEYRCDYTWDSGVTTDAGTGLSRDNFGEKVTDKSAKVLYNLGARIVGGSRLHLLIAMELVHQTGALILDGDTDSMKIALNGVAVEDIDAALQPLHRAARRAIDVAQQYVRADYPQFVSDLDGIGLFECENSDSHYTDYFPAWNKARVALDPEGKPHVTLAGVSRPAGRANVETWVRDYMQGGHTFEDAAGALFGFNSFIDVSVSNSLEKQQPAFCERVHIENATDYLGNVCTVDAPRAIALYEHGRAINDASKPVNAETLAYLCREGVTVDTDPKTVQYIHGVATLTREEF